ncbi:LytR/AlgR family response regulator transcription factor [Aureitalea marina]|uniref:DNA-binding response regulator n=1 Tax=Aureitalea marina TaxID=930804 RepID=A0A2S7KSX3_9FLAO|nr:LytTR family DNA-binding domain-containing protein [Aureitalea marina]PQB05716.1 DNA-binding response regulator [Aureitalea marina]
MQLLIIEDEPRAVRQLRSLLDASGYDFNLLQVIDSVEEAVNWFRKGIAVDLVFMDIQLADGLSFEIFEKVDVQTPIIFTTAFDQYTLQAFKVNSIDYLLKPVRQKDLNTALAKYQKNHSLFIPQSDLLKSLLAQMQREEYRNGMLVRDGKSQVQLPVQDFQYFFSKDSLTYGVTRQKRYLIEETLDQLSATLDPAHFFKINRGQILAKAAIYKIDPYFNHRSKVTLSMNTDEQFIVSRARTSDFKSWLNR